MTIAEGALFTRFEEATAIAALSEAIYIAHVAGATPYISPGDAVRVAAMIFGLAQSDGAHEMVKRAISDPAAVVKDFNAMSFNIGHQATIDKDARAEKFASALNAGKESLAKRS